VKLVFLGTPAAAVPSFRALIDAGHDVRLAVTQPDRPTGRSRRPVPPPVKLAASEAGVEVFQPEKVRTRAFSETLLNRGPDVLVVVAYGRILSRRALDVAPRGAVNVHFSLLPELRGAAPVQWALARGAGTTGVTTMRMNERMDEGDVLLQRSVAIEPGEHTPALERRLADLGAGLLVETLARLERGDLRPDPQDHARATLAPLLRKADGEVDPRTTAREIEGRVRGFDPWPGVWLARGGRRLRIVAARALDGETTGEPPGTVLEHRNDGLRVACGEGSVLLVTRVQPEGKRALDAADAVNGRQIRVGDRLERIPAEA